MRLRPYQSGDEDAFDMREDFAEERRVNAWNWAKGPPGPAWTLVEGEQVLGVGGVIQGEGGAWGAWASLADLPARRWPEAVRLAGIVCDHVLARPDVRWLWAQCRAERRGGRLLLQRLGFRLHHVERPEALGCEILCMLREG